MFMSFELSNKDTEQAFLCQPPQSRVWRDGFGKKGPCESSEHPTSYVNFNNPKNLGK